MKDSNKQEKLEHVFIEGECGGLAPRRVVEPPRPIIELPPGVYHIHVSQDLGPHFHRVEQVKPPAKMYGKVNTRVARYFHTFEMGAGNLGIMLLGQKGAGKTAEKLQMVDQAIRLNMAVVEVPQFINPYLIGELLSKVKQDILVTFDEVDKTYGQIQNDDHGDDTMPQQTGLLGLLDGATGGGKKMFVLAGNAGSKISEYLKDRPSRIRYTQQFDVLPMDVVEHYVRENLIGSTHKSRSNVYKLIHQSQGAFNFDMMKALIEEMNMYKEDVFTVVSLMYGTLQISTPQTEYLVSRDGPNGQPIDWSGREQYDGNGGFKIEVNGDVDPATGEYDKATQFTLTDEHLTEFCQDGSAYYVKDEVTYYLYPLAKAMLHTGWVNHKWTPAEESIMKRVHDLITRRQDAKDAFRKKKDAEAAAAKATQASEVVPSKSQPDGGQAVQDVHSATGKISALAGSGGDAGQNEGRVRQGDEHQAAAASVVTEHTLSPGGDSESAEVFLTEVATASWGRYSGGLQAGDVIAFANDPAVNGLYISETGNIVRRDANKVQNNSISGAHVPGSIQMVTYKFGNGADGAGDLTPPPADLPW